MAKALGARDIVKSPTFNLLHIYSCKLPLYHFDFYRLNAKELEPLGFEELIYDSEGIVVIEWPERMKESLPHATRWIHLRMTKPNERKITFKKVKK